MTTDTVATTAATSRPLRTAEFLFGADREGLKALSSALTEAGVVAGATSTLTNLSRAGRGAVSSQIASVAHGLLDLDIGEIVSEGWRRMEDLVQAAQRSVATPGSSEVVDLATHSVSSKHTPRVDLLVNNVVIAKVEFELTLELVLKSVVASIRGGRLVEVHSGDCDITGKLSAEGRQLAKRQAHYAVPALLRLGDGIPLVAAETLVVVATAGAADPVVVVASAGATDPLVVIDPAVESLDVGDGSAAAPGRAEDAASDLPADHGAG
jgi:hypothetical protein